MNGVEPWRQTVWDWRAAGNFIGGGSGSGLLLVTAITALNGRTTAAPVWLSAVLVAAGLGLVWSELGRPWRFLHVFFNPRTSWMARESIVAVPLLLFTLAAALTGSTGLLWAAALTGMAFLYCQARILIAAKGIPAWRTPRIMGLMLSTGLAEGAGLYLLAAPWQATGAMENTSSLILILLSVLIVGRALAWRVYRDALQDNAPTAALAVLDRSRLPFAAVGHILPLLAVAAAWLVPDTRPLWMMLAGAGALLGGGYIKFVIVTRAAFNQGYAIDHAPARGGGAPGPGAKPGWD